MGCACRKGARAAQYVWTDGQTTIVYSTEIQARAKVLRSGGTYTKKES